MLYTPPGGPIFHSRGRRAPLQMLKRLYPLKTLPNQRTLWGWISFDVANQSFTLLINTLLFSIFFTEVVVTDPERKNTLWSLTYASSMLITVVLSPIFGAVTDERGWKKECLLVSGLVCGILTCLFGLIAPGQLWLAALLYIPANVAYSLGENFLASFLPEIAERKHFGRVSAFSWGLAYAAALVILAITAAIMIGMGLQQPDSWRPMFVFAGLWFLAFTVPTLLWLKEKRSVQAGPCRNVIAAGLTRLVASFRSTRSFPDLVMLMFASLFYGTGMSVVVFFASIIAQEFGFQSTQLVLFVGVITISGVAGTLIPLFLQDRIGHKKTTLLLLGLWLVTTLGLAYYAFARSQSASPDTYPTWPLWLFGNLLGAGLGSLGSANRAFVGYLTPESRSGEIFGLWGLVFKLAAVCTIPFAVVKDKLGTPASLLVLAGFLVLGFLLTLLIQEGRGREAAAQTDANAGIAPVP